MPGRKKRTNRVLILITVLLCLAFGTIFTQSSSAVEPKSNQDTLPDIIVADDADTQKMKFQANGLSQKINGTTTWTKNQSLAGKPSVLTLIILIKKES